MFDKLKALMDMQKKMQEIKRELDNSSFEISSADGFIRISMNGSQEVRNVEITGNLEALDKKKFEQTLKDTYNKAIKRSHEIAAEKMKNVTGLNLPGM
ncbi:MAG: YbaB/EbfC family nucleoid-associated protein [Candidatus Omnitrophica bacterium]|nr:YbaB/EbfC family nucleoid-associated protein [Candidatus Omnitrophota bacterium]